MRKTMDNNRQKELLELLAQAQEEVLNGNEVSTEFARVLFPPARKEYELTYYGKESEQAVISQTFAVPLQENRRFGETTESDWLNKIIFGDNLQVLKTLVEMKHRGELKNADGAYLAVSHGWIILGAIRAMRDGFNLFDI